jgi:uncharacterized membrane protein YtjA (UPF0391 family)
MIGCVEMARCPSGWRAFSWPQGNSRRFGRSHRGKGRLRMLRAAFIFAIIALVLGLLGFGGIAGFAWDIAKILFFIALAVAALFLILGVTIYKKVT